MANCTDFPLIFCGNGPKWTKTIQTRFSLEKIWDIQGNLVWHRQSSLIRHKNTNKESVKGCKVRKIQISWQKLSSLMSCHKMPSLRKTTCVTVQFKRFFLMQNSQKTKPSHKKHSQKPIHKQVGTEQDQRGQYLPRWFYALFCYLCLFLGLDTCIISKPHKQSYKSSI